jgi:L-alanine-DL-glutamate epimerase-like enolase superfamily enzyme
MSREIQPDKEAERLKKLHGEVGYKAFKIRIGSVAGHNQDQWKGRTQAIIPTVRKGVGEEIALLADANSCYTPPKAIEVGKLMQDHNYVQFEEPCPFWEREWTAEVTAALDLDVSGGEQDNEPATWRHMINIHAVDIVQPDPLYLGGIIQTLRVAKKAEQTGMTCVPHSANRAMVTLFSLHLLGAIPNAGNYVEYSIEDTPWSDRLFEPGFKVIDGTVRIPDGPGWGITVSQDWFDQAERESSEA